MCVYMCGQRREREASFHFFSLFLFVFVQKHASFPLSVVKSKSTHSPRLSKSKRKKHNREEGEKEEDKEEDKEEERYR